MFTPSIDKLVQSVLESISSALPESIKDVEQDLKTNLQEALKATFSKLDLVTREEFDVQTKVLTRTREKLEALEKKLETL